MATKRQLLDRWHEPEGRECAENLFDALEQKAPRDELSQFLAGLPYADEVAPSLDLRGLEFRYAITLSDLDLSGRGSKGQS